MSAGHEARRDRPGTRAPGVTLETPGPTSRTIAGNVAARDVGQLDGHAGHAAPNEDVQMVQAARLDLDDDHAWSG